LVALGAAIYVLISIQMTTSTGDTTRIIGQVVVGVGFLGAGVILHNGMDVQGLTTATTIWCSSAVGCLAGGGFLLETFLCAIIIVVLNSSLLRVDEWLKKRGE
jgi:putative Mg2+ transporter-C (MgtC) family protein